jgi:thiol-disulfide isomerase/thioredoxin
MSTENIERTEQEPQGRNPIVLIAGLVILVAALAFLIFGGSLFGGDASSQPAAVDLTQGEVTTAQLPESGPPLQVGDQPYEFNLQGVDGQSVALSQFIGRPILVNFWATWCGPCRIEMPEIQAIWEEHKDDGLVVLALDQSETAEDVQAYFDELGLTFTPLLDEGNRTARNFGLQGTLPASVFINPDSEVSVIHRGVMTRGQLDGFLEQTLTS